MHWKLKGDLAGSWACTVDFEYRIVFEFVQDLKTQEEMILLETVGTHDEVY
jgi:mRNA-degrading endonuclease YafQ of YafQ-DinJ toxin-antitoxin module